MLRRSILVMVVCAPAVARADEWSLHLLGSAMAGWTDNLFSAPEERPPNIPDDQIVPEVDSDFYYQVTPGALFSYETPRMVHGLGYELDANFYQDHGDAGSLTHRASWRGHFITGPRSELGTSATYSMGQTNALVGRNAAMTETGAQGGGTSDFIQADLTENFSFTVTRPLRLTQGLLGRRYETKDEQNTKTTGMELGGSLGIDRTWRDDAVGLLTNVRYVELSRLTPDVMSPTGSSIESSDSMNLQAVLSWRRDLGRHWSSLLDAGATVLLPINEGEDTVVQPTFGGQLTYFPDWGQAYAQVRRSVAPNLYIAENTITDSAVVSLGLPLPWLTDDPALPRLSIQGTGGVTRTQIIDLADDNVDAGFDVFTGDVAVAYTPRNAVAIALRYQYVRQNATGEDERSGFDYTRNTVMLNVYGRWPDRLAGEVPSNESLRVQGEATVEAGAGDEEDAGNSSGSRTR